MNDAIASLIKELLAQKLAAEAALSDAAFRESKWADDCHAAEAALSEAQQELAIVKRAHVRSADNLSDAQQQVTQQAATISTLCEVIGEYQSWHLPHIEDVGCPLCAKCRSALASTPETATIADLRDALFNARRKATEVVDAIIMYRNKYSNKTYLEGAGRVRNEVGELIDAALASIPKDKLAQQAATISHLARALDAAIHALRSYEHGNASPDIARLVANACVEALSGIPKEKP